MSFTPEMVIVLLVLAAAIVFFITEWLRVDVVALSVVAVLMLTGVITTSQALEGFATSTVMTVAALFIVGGAVLQSGLSARIADRILKVAGTSERRLMFVIMLSVAVLSGFISSTGTVAVLMPAIVSLGARVKISPSRLLMPLAFGSLLGGAATLIGTPPNIIVSDVLAEAGFGRFDFFTFTPLGLVLILVGVVYMVFIGRALLPDHKTTELDIQPVNTPEELFDIYRLPDNLFRLRVRTQSPLVGQSLEGSDIGRDYAVSVLEILRPPPPRQVARIAGQAIVLQSDQLELIHPSRNPTLQVNDVLLVKGDGLDVSRMAAKRNLAIQPATTDDQQALISREVGMVEAVIPPRSNMIGETLVSTNFGRDHRLSVLDIRRPAYDGQLDLKTTRLRFGDTLLVQGEWKDIMTLKRRQRDFMVLGETHYMKDGVAKPGKAGIVLVILLGMLLLMVSGWVSVAAASLIAALAVVFSGTLNMDEAYQAIDWKSIMLIAGMWPLSTALTEVGLVDVIAGGFTESLGAAGPMAVMAGLFAMTAVFTQVLSNTTTAVLVAPIAVAAAASMGVAPQAFLMAIAVAASMAFASPVSSPVNTLVMGAGQYRFGDYFKVGAPLIVIMMIVTMLVLPLLFPF